MSCGLSRCYLISSIICFVGAIICVVIFAFTTDVLLYIGFVLIFFAAVFGTLYGLNRRGKASSNKKIKCCGLTVYESREIESHPTTYTNQVSQDEELANEMASQDKQIQNMLKECFRLNGELRKVSRTIDPNKYKELHNIVKAQQNRLQNYMHQPLIPKQQLNRVQEKLRHVRYQIQSLPPKQSNLQMRRNHREVVNQEEKTPNSKQPNIPATNPEVITSIPDVIPERLSSDDSGIINPPSEIAAIPNIGQYPQQPEHNRRPLRAHRLVRSTSQHDQSTTSSGLNTQTPYERIIIKPGKQNPIDAIRPAGHSSPFSTPVHSRQSSVFVIGALENEPIRTKNTTRVDTSSSPIKEGRRWGSHQVIDDNIREPTILQPLSVENLARHNSRENFDTLVTSDEVNNETQEHGTINQPKPPYHHQKRFNDNKIITQTNQHQKNGESNAHTRQERLVHKNPDPSTSRLNDYKKRRKHRNKTGRQVQRGSETPSAVKSLGPPSDISGPPGYHTNQGTVV